MLVTAEPQHRLHWMTPTSSTRRSPPVQPHLASCWALRVWVTLTYAYGSSLYLHYALPGGFIPSTRQELATVLWTTAGKPDPVSTTLYTDIPADNIEQQKAARWCAEQGLLSDHGATFGPDTKVTNARIIRAWNSLKKVPVTITK